jgi:transcriptional regulator with XRE-family HTH domain
MNGREIVGWNLRRLRVSQDISQERLAYDSGVDRSYLGGLERGEENPTVDVLERLAISLNVKLAAILEEPAPDAPAPQPLKRGRKPR